MQIEIRKYSGGDEPAVIALWTEILFNGAPHNDPATSLRKKLETDPELLFVAAIDGQVVGTVMGGYDGHRGWIYSLAVDDRYRRRGIGAALIRRVEAALIDRGCLKINLQVRNSNAEVIAFYRKLGYSVDEVLSMGKRVLENG